MLRFVDDADGRADLFLANGHVEDHVQEVQKAVSYREAPILYWNAGDGKSGADGGLSVVELLPGFKTEDHHAPPGRQNFVFGIHTVAGAAPILLSQEIHGKI